MDRGWRPRTRRSGRRCTSTRRFGGSARHFAGDRPGHDDFRFGNTLRNFKWLGMWLKGRDYFEDFPLLSAYADRWAACEVSAPGALRFGGLVVYMVQLDCGVPGF